MRCRTCDSVMVIDHCESGTGATTCWHSCPLCGKVRLTSEPGSERTDVLSAAARPDEDDGGYAVAPPAIGPDLEA